MAYATIQDLVTQAGEAEIARLSTPDGADVAGVDPTRVQPVLDEVSGQMDSYLRRHYAVPVSPVPAELRACCVAMARYELAFTGRSEPAESVRLAHKTRITWLQGLADGRVTLEGVAAEGTMTGAIATDRMPTFTAGGALSW